MHNCIPLLIPICRPQVHHQQQKLYRYFTKVHQPGDARYRTKKAEINSLWVNDLACSIADIKADYRWWR